MDGLAVELVVHQLHGVDEDTDTATCSCGAAMPIGEWIDHAVSSAELRTTTPRPPDRPLLDPTIDA